MKVEKEWKTDLLDVPVGTKMYLAITDRAHRGVFIEEVIYDGYTSEFVQRDYYEPGKMRAPVYWTEPEYTVKFKRTTGKSVISFKCKENNWSGQRGYDTNEHLECGMDCSLKGVKPSAYGWVGFFCLDAYFTTDKDLFVKYCTENIPSAKEFIEDADASYEKELAELERQYEKDKKELTKRYEARKRAFEGVVKFTEKQ